MRPSDTRGAPALPPRSSSSRTGNYATNSALSIASNDPRRSSTQSLVPVKSQIAQKRKLLLIYIHGFMGTETSFRSFPAHVHNLVSITLADSHVVHSKIYPRYAARRTIDQVAEDFSRWLSPHENSNTDVVLLSHSMGGLIGAEVELLPAENPVPGNTFRHRIIGMVNFDVPFLGMHPSVVGTGIGSIFKPAEPPTDMPLDLAGASLSPASSLTTESSSSSAPQRPSRMDTLFSQPTDPNFNPKFTNDVILPMRKGWQNAMHFMNKHSDNLRKATKQLVKSHVEFGGAMADYTSLRIRYMRVRALEDENATIRKRLAHVPQVPARVRFVNYYTASTGRNKKSRSRSRSKSPYGQHPGSSTTLGASTHHLNPSQQSLSSTSASVSPRISVDEHVGDSVVHKGTIETGQDLAALDPTPMEVDPVSERPAKDTTVKTLAEEDSESPLPHIHVQMPNLPPLPPPPMKPAPLDLTIYPDAAAQDIIRRDHARQMRAYEQALRDREAAEQDRKDLETKLRRLALGMDEQASKQQHEGVEQQSTGLGNATEESSSADTRELVGNPSTPTETISAFSVDRDDDPPMAPESTKRKKDRKFCALPKKINGERDPLWVRVYMENHDEVSAHTGLFYTSETYERLVGDVGARIEEWIRDDMTRRMIDEYAE